MADDLVGKIRVLKATLEDFKKRISTFSRLEKTLHDSEVFLNLQISDLTDEFNKAKALHADVIARGDDNLVDFVEYRSNKIFEAIQNIFFKHSTTLHEYVKIVSKPERRDDATFLESTHAVNNKGNCNSNCSAQIFPFDMSLSYISGLVPKFDGTSSMWPEFMDAYVSNVHDNESLTDGSKFKILQSLLKGDALKVVKREFGFLKACDYVSIWEKLVHRYNHKRSIVYAYFQELCFQPAMNKETASNLKSIYDTSYDSVVGLKSLGLPVDGWGDLLLFLTYSKLPLVTKEKWDERHNKADSLPNFNKFLEFLEHRFRTLEGLEVIRNNSQKANQAETVHGNKNSSTRKVSTLQTTSSKSQSEANSKNICKFCKKGSHALRKCFSFKKLKVQDRIKTVNSLGYCTNCLSYSHLITSCTSQGRCEHCKEMHNSILCEKSQVIQKSPRFAGSSDSQNINPQSQSVAQTDGRLSQSDLGTYSTMVSALDDSDRVVFPTALVKVISSTGQSVILRAMIDSCSDACYITEHAVRILKLKMKRTEVQTNGLGNCPTASCVGLVSFEVLSTVNNSFRKPVSAYVLDMISQNRPVSNFRITEPINESIQLADPTFNRNSKIDLLLGGSFDASIFKNRSFKSKNDNVIFRETELGWIVSGSIPQLNCFSTIVSKPSQTNSKSLELVLKSLDSSLRRFWELELEGISEKRELTMEEKICENIYENTTKRLPSGRYCVRLPFQKNNREFENMRGIALKRFSFLERKLEKDLKLRAEYSACMQEYIDLQHMTEVDSSLFRSAYYIPHHCVIKESSSTTKLRVVFDASAKDANVQCLNDNLFNGPRLQPDLIDHLLRFRTFKIAFTADIAKMYRQILVHPDDRKFQMVLWRSNSTEPIRTFCLNTVTFGTKPAPYLAVKTLLQVAEDEKHNFPESYDCLTHGFYVDDCIFGADTVQDAKSVQSQVIQALRTAGFHLRKWSSNSSEVLESVPDSDRETKSLFDFDGKTAVKTLGVQWSPSNDHFCYNFSFPTVDVYTKRNILSDIAKVFDPLGWISPCLITARLLIQELWANKSTWDEPISVEKFKKWDELRNGLAELSNNIFIPRWVNSTTSSNIEIHGFSDASSLAYSAVIYLKTEFEGNPIIHLLCAKSRVAPLKKISIPRLELVAALMLAKLTAHIKSVLQFSNAKYFHWSDSQIVLAWLRDSPHKRTVFVANRITEIQTLSDSKQWRYIDTKNNPADLGTRGICPKELPNLSLWWNGPKCLLTFDEEVECPSDEAVELPLEDNAKVKLQIKNPTSNIIETFLSIHQPKLSNVTANIMKFSMDSLNKFSTLTRLVRVVAFCLRFLKKNRSQSCFIHPDEYDRALIVLLRVVQDEVYRADIEQIQSGELSKASSIYSLSPFINKEDGLLRVSGRLQEASQLNYDQRHPIILPYSHLISKLIVRQAHISTMHGNQQQTMMLIIQRYHIIRGKRLVNTVLNRCVKCFRQRCAAQNQLMGQLPQLRVTPNRAFLNCGVDFAGPFTLKRFKGRCQSSVKGYFAIFVCFATKAVHIEVVTDLSTPAFIASFRRFIGRRGMVKNLHSDCGSNFVGAKGVITRNMSELESQWHAEMAKELAAFHTSWHYNPPGTPHFGGLWEAGVKSVKYHLKRIIGDTRLSYDEFETILIQVESCLNSRPLCEIRTETDAVIITPGHFLIQDNLLALPDDNRASERTSLVDRWNFLQKIVQDFWNIWSLEYLNTLRQRKKWRDQQENIKVGDVVVLIDKNIPPNSWLLAHVTETHPGKDGLVRVVTLKTKTSTLKRPVTKICPLPIQTE